MALTTTDALARLHELGIALVVDREPLAADRPLTEREVRDALDRRNAEWRDDDFDPAQILNYNLLDGAAAMALLAGLAEQPSDVLAALRGASLDLGAFGLRLRRGNGFGARALGRAWRLERVLGQWTVTPHVDREDAASDLRVAVGEETIRQKVLETLNARIAAAAEAETTLQVYRETAHRRLVLMQRVRLRLSKLLATTLEPEGAYEEFDARALRADVARLTAALEAEQGWGGARLPPMPDGADEPVPAISEASPSADTAPSDAGEPPVTANPPVPVPAPPQGAPSWAPPGVAEGLRPLLQSLTRATSSALEHGVALAVEYGAYEVTGEHLLLALLETHGSDVACLLASQPAAAVELVATLRRAIDEQRSGSTDEPTLQPALVDWLSDAARLAPSRRVRSGALLRLLARDPRRYVVADLAAQLPRLLELVAELDGPATLDSVEQIEVGARPSPQGVKPTLAAIDVRVAYPSGARSGRGAGGRRELPPKILVLGDFSPGGASEPLAGRNPWRVDHDTLDAALAKRRVRLDLALGLTPAPISLTFSELADFEPDSIVRRVFALRQLTAPAGGGSQADPALVGALDRLLHGSAFERLERSWRSLKFLLDRWEPSAAIRIEVMDCTLEELARDFDEAPELTRSSLFSLLHTGEYGGAGGTPYTAVVADLSFGGSLSSMLVLRRCAAVAAMVHAPFLAGLDPGFLGSLKRRPQKAEPHEVEGALAHELWRSLTGTEEARYLALSSQRLRLRDAYVPGAPGATSIPYREAPSLSGFTGLAGNGAFAVAAQLVASLSRDRSGAHLEDVLQGPAFDLFPALSSREAEETVRLGVLAFARGAPPDGGLALHAKSCRTTSESGAHVPRGDLEQTFFASRFIQHLKWLYLETAWSTGGKNQAALERRANEWLAEYVVDANHPERPLLSAAFRIEREGPGFDRVRLELTARAQDGSGVPIAASGWFRRD